MKHIKLFENFKNVDLSDYMELIKGKFANGLKLGDILSENTFLKQQVVLDVCPSNLYRIYENDISLISFYFLTPLQKWDLEHKIIDKVISNIFSEKVVDITFGKFNTDKKSLDFIIKTNKGNEYSSVLRKDGKFFLFIPKFVKEQSLIGSLFRPKDLSPISTSCSKNDIITQSSDKNKLMVILKDMFDDDDDEIEFILDIREGWIKNLYDFPNREARITTMVGKNLGSIKRLLIPPFRKINTSVFI